MNKDRESRLVDITKDLLQITDSVDVILKEELYEFSRNLDEFSMWLDNREEDEAVRRDRFFDFGDGKLSEDEANKLFDGKSIYMRDAIEYLNEAHDHIIKAIHYIVKAAKN